MTLRENSQDSSILSNENSNNPNTNGNKDRITQKESTTISEDSNSTNLINGWYKGKLLSPDVVNLWQKALSKVEFSLPPKGLKIITTSWNIKITKIKVLLEIFSRIFRLMWRFRKEEQESTFNPLQKKRKELLLKVI